ncbi:MAG: LysM peptidoglycan-binding domain-containing protein [Verrucomicrobiota bacterium JB023]|nr:LysM peptidoglycan-binding domain-containing protein [Verrucomicrobiota bacterium JB023]
MSFSSFIKGLAALIVLTVMGATVWWVWKVNRDIATVELESTVMLDRLESKELPDVEPGDRAFQRAIELIATGELEAAKEKLHFIVNFSPGSAAAREARRILGEVHLDELFIGKNDRGRTIHTVEKGDAPFALAKQYETTLDCMMALNGMYDLQIHPGDELAMLALNFSLRIDVGKDTITLRRMVSEEPRRDEFVKEYEIVRYRLNSLSQNLTVAKVENKYGLRDGKPLNTLSDDYRSASKVVIVKKGKTVWQIRSMPAEGDELPEGNGFFLAPHDMEELAVLLRVGNRVEIVKDQKE